MCWVDRPCQYHVVSHILSGLYFKKHLGAVNGFVAAGSSAFTFLLSFLNPLFLNNFGVTYIEGRDEVV